MKSWEDIEREILNCTKCKLSSTRTHAVPGEGNRESKIVFIGEAPGAREDELGRPFVGAAGNLLTKLIDKYLNLKREQVYITNLVKCRPPNNRDPEEDEIRACSPYLLIQLEMIRPKVVVTLGRHSTAFFLTLAGNEKASISKVRGRPFKLKTGFGELLIYPTYHPAAALYNPSLMRELESDFSKLKELLGGSIASKAITLDNFFDGNESRS